MPAEYIIQDNHERIRHTIAIEPEGVEEALPDADRIEWYLTTRKDLGEGSVVASYTSADPELTVTGTDTFEVNLVPAVTRELSPGARWVEVTVIWRGQPTTIAMQPSLVVQESMHDSTAG